ncbi:helix-turn-helix domain-containing protein, partial [Clostridioides sp. ZZV14-6048]
MKRLRKIHQYTQEELAEKLNISRQSVAKWENGESTPDIDSC